MSAIKIYSTLGIVMWDHRPVERFAPHDEFCDILRAAIKSRFSADMLLLRMRYSVNIYITYSLYSDDITGHLSDQDIEVF